MSSLGIIIVAYNSKAFLHASLQSVFPQAGTSTRVTVVDNASDDQDFSQLQEAFPEARFLLNSKNLGFAAACNRGIREAPADFFLLLNPDCVVQGDGIPKTLRFLEQNPAVGIAGCRVENPDGTLQRAARRAIPTPATALFRFTGLSRLFPQSRRLAAYNMGDLDEKTTHEVGAVSGSFLMFRRELVDAIGSLDEAFFLYGEDLDFCYRASQAGWKVVYYPEARVVHHKSRSSSQAVRTSTYHFYDAMRIFYRKHFWERARWPERVSVLTAIRMMYWSRRLRQIVLRDRTVGSEG